MLVAWIALIQWLCLFKSSGASFFCPHAYNVLPFLSGQEKNWAKI